MYIMHCAVLYCMVHISQYIVLYCTVQYTGIVQNTVQNSTFWRVLLYIHTVNLQYSTVQYSTVQYSTVQYSTVQYSTVQYSTVQYSTVQYSTAGLAVHSYSNGLY